MLKFKSAVQCIGLLAVTFPSVVHAQAYQCRPPLNVRAAPAVEKSAGERRRVKTIDGYVLALSWSPEFCKGREKDAKHRLQCSGEMADFGFILHGLWPEARGRDYPQWCERTRPLAAKNVKKNLCMMPSARLQQHEWAKHGSCMTKRPETYFRVSRLLYGALQYPDMIRLSYKPLTVGQFRTKFAETNAGLRPEMVRVKTNKRGWLQEVKVCLGKSFKPRKCPAHLRRSADQKPVKIWRGN